VKNKLRFSLLGLFSLVTIVALAISLYLTRSRLASAEQELERLRQAAGHLSITQAEKVHVIAVPTADALSWRWRVYLPGGHDFGIYSHCGSIDASGLPDKGFRNSSRVGGQSNPNEPREILLDVALGKTPEGASCLWISENGQHVGAVYFESSPPTWLNAMSKEQTAGERTTVTADVDTPLALLSLDGLTANKATCEDAVLLWIGKYERGFRPEQTLREKGMLPWKP